MVPILWEVIESSWKAFPPLDRTRQRAVRLNNQGALLQLSYMLDGLIANQCRRQLQSFSSEQLLAFIHQLEAQLSCLDRPELIAIFGDNPHSALWARGFIIGMGEAYFHKIDLAPQKAYKGLEAKSICHIGYEVWELSLDRSTPTVPALKSMPG